MGIEIHLEIAPKRITPEQWHSVYKECLKLVESFPLLDYRTGERNGREYDYAVKTVERDDALEGYRAWESYGDMFTGFNTEWFGMADDIGRYTESTDGDDNGADILTYLVSLYGQDYYPEIPLISKKSMAGVFFGKTQGEYSHIYLLTIACLINDRLPEASVLYGEINVGQCRRAVDLANRYLEKPISLPVQCDAEKLLRRILMFDGIEKMGKQGGTLEILYELTLENRDEKMGSVIQKYLPKDEILNYYKKKLVDDNDYSFKDSVKEYLSLGFDFGDLVRLLVLDPEGRKLSPSEFFDLIIGMQLHVEEKETYDMTKGDMDNGRPDTVGMQLARILGRMSGAYNRNVDAYIPLSEITETCRDILGDVCDVDQEMAEALKRDEEKHADPSETDKIQESFYGGEDSERAQYVRERLEEAEETEKYDISELRDIAFYERGDTVWPKFEEEIVDNFQQLYQLTDQYDGFTAMSKEEREDFFLDRSDRVMLPEETWNRIFDHIMDDRYMRPFYALFIVSLSSDKVRNFATYSLMHPDFIEDYWEKATSDMQQERSES